MKKSSAVLGKKSHTLGFFCFSEGKDLHSTWYNC